MMHRYGEGKQQHNGYLCMVCRPFKNTRLLSITIMTSSVNGFDSLVSPNIHPYSYRPLVSLLPFRVAGFSKSAHRLPLVISIP